MMTIRHTLLLLSLLAADAFSIATSTSDECVYTLYVRTGSVIKAGTDAKIGLALGDTSGHRFQIEDLQSWGGLMGPDHDYFERGQLDAFSGRGPCGLSAPICSLNLTSDASGAHHGWFCEYVEVTATGPHVPCTQTLFYVRQWLANDAPPYQLYATVDGCHQVPAQQAQGKVKNRLGAHFVIGGEDEGSRTSISSASM